MDPKVFLRLLDGMSLAPSGGRGAELQPEVHSLEVSALSLPLTLSHSLSHTHSLSLTLSHSQAQPLLRGQAVRQTLELLLPQADLVVQLALLDDEGRLHLHEVLVVGQALVRQVVGQDVVDQPLPAVQVLLQLLGVLVLADQQRALVCQCALWRERTEQTPFRIQEGQSLTEGHVGSACFLNVDTEWMNLEPSALWQCVVRQNVYF